MRAVQRKAETRFLRGFAKTYFAEISFTAKAEVQMREQGVTLASIQQVLRGGSVTDSEKEEADGARWIVEGETCDEDLLRLWLDVYVDRYCMRIVRVNRIARV